MLQIYYGYSEVFVNDQSAYQPPLWLDEWPVLPVHLVVESAGIAEVVAIAVTAPQRSRSRAAVHALAAL
jgi:hypothetical protein